MQIDYEIVEHKSGLIKTLVLRDRSTKMPIMYLSITEGAIAPYIYLIRWDLDGEGARVGISGTKIIPDCDLEEILFVAYELIHVLKADIDTIKAALTGRVIAATAAANSDPMIPSSWVDFVTRAVAVHTAKDADYEHAFMKMLTNQDFPSYEVWRWEVKKKLDRLRRWVKRGQLEVKGEGVLDSIIDLCNYTVQYHIFSTTKEPFKALTEEKFTKRYFQLGSNGIYGILHSSGLLDPGDAVEDAVIALLNEYLCVGK